MHLTDGLASYQHLTHPLYIKDASFMFGLLEYAVVSSQHGLSMLRPREH